MTAPTEVTETVYTDTVAVLPGYARAVATELRAPSERWHQYQEPPATYFDDAFGGLAYNMSPAAREAYQDESVLGRALKVLSATCMHYVTPREAGDMHSKLHYMLVKGHSTGAREWAAAVQFCCCIWEALTMQLPSQASVSLSRQVFQGHSKRTFRSLKKQQ